MYVTEMLGDGGAYEKISPADTATGLAATTIQPTSGLAKGLFAKGILVTGEDETVHFTTDGTAPTAAAGTNVGHRLSADQSIVIRGQNNIKNFQVIDAVSGSTGSVKVTAYF